MPLDHFESLFKKVEIPPEIVSLVIKSVKDYGLKEDQDFVAKFL